MATTFAEIAEKITKKIGKLEKDIKSTEPDIRATAERTLPRLKQAMQSLMQSNDQVKAVKEANQRQTMLAKGGDVPSYATGGASDPAMDLMMQNWQRAMAQKETEDYLAGGAGNSGYSLDELNASGPKAFSMDNLTKGQVDLTGGQGPYDESGIRPTEYGIKTLGEGYSADPGDPKDPREENSVLKNLYSAAQNAMVTAPFGYDYGPTEYYNPVYNQAEEQSLGNLSEMERQLASARELAMQDTMLDTKDQRMAVEKARQRNIKDSKEASGPEKFALQQMSNANAKDSMMQIGAQKARQEAMLNSGAAKSQRVFPMAAQQAQLAQMRNAIGGQRAQQDSYAQEHGLKTDAAMNALQMGKLSNMSKWAQMQQLMANKQGMDEKSFQAMMNMYSDPAIREMYGNIG